MTAKPADLFATCDREIAAQLVTRAQALYTLATLVMAANVVWLSIDGRRAKLKSRDLGEVEDVADLKALIVEKKLLPSVTSPVQFDLHFRGKTLDEEAAPPDGTSGDEPLIAIIVEGRAR